MNHYNFFEYLIMIWGFIGLMLFIVRGYELISVSEDLFKKEWNIKQRTFYGFILGPFFWVLFIVAVCFIFVIDIFQRLSDYIWKKLE